MKVNYELDWQEPSKPPIEGEDIVAVMRTFDGDYYMTDDIWFDKQDEEWRVRNNDWDDGCSYEGHWEEPEHSIVVAWAYKPEMDTYKPAGGSLAANLDKITADMNFLGLEFEDTYKSYADDDDYRGMTLLVYQRKGIESTVEIPLNSVQEHTEVGTFAPWWADMFKDIRARARRGEI